MGTRDGVFPNCPKFSRQAKRGNNDDRFYYYNEAEKYTFVSKFQGEHGNMIWSGRREASIETNGRPQNAIGQDIRRGATTEDGAENKKRTTTTTTEMKRPSNGSAERRRRRSCRSVRKPEQDVSTQHRDPRPPRCGEMRFGAIFKCILQPQVSLSVYQLQCLWPASFATSSIIPNSIGEPLCSDIYLRSSVRFDETIARAFRSTERERERVRADE